MSKAPRFISIQTREGNSTSFAIAKARADIDAILEQAGFTPIVFGSLFHVGFVRDLKRRYDISRLRYLLKSTDSVFVQFPWIHKKKSEFYQNLLKYGKKVSCIIHDIDHLRQSTAATLFELEQLRKFHSIIAHTPAMKEYLVNNGIEEERIKILYTFPYLTDDPIHDLSHYKTPTVIFAGNLLKSPFVNKLKDIATPYLRFNIYGNGAEHFVESDYVHYKGIFSPIHPGVIEGNWGLIWDGPNIDTCNGEFGSYLRYNSSHKISMCLALGIPLILWEQSALKDFVLENNLGITIDSLHNLEAALRSLTPEKLALIHDSTRAYSTIVRSGDNLRKLL